MRKISRKSILFSLFVISFLLISIGLILNSYAYTEAVKSIDFSSQKLSYQEKEPGSIGIEKSAEWIEKGKARVTFNLNTVLKTVIKPMDVIFILDISGSMEGEKLQRVKNDTIHLLNLLLSNDESSAALITFHRYSEIISGFTHNKEDLINKVNSMTETGSTNYYQALKNADTVLKNYKKQDGKDCIMLFLTDGYPNEDVPNQIAQYAYLKSQYPWLTIQGIQYEMAEQILNPIREISDNQFIANRDTLNNVLLNATIVPVTYDHLVLTDYIDNNYFDIESISKIKTSFGEVALEYENGVPKVIWTLDQFKSGESATMTIDLNLKSEYFDVGGFYPTNQKEEIVYKIDDTEETVPSDKTPILPTQFQVSYDGNAPSGCKLKDVPASEGKMVYETVEISSTEPSCQGYKFKGWNIITPTAKKIGDNYFIMPEEDVIIRAIWSKITINKLMTGIIQPYEPAILQEVPKNYDEKLWKYKDSITKIVFQNELSDLTNVKESFDISEGNYENIMSYIIPNTDNPNTYTVYIQGEREIIANSNSSYLFRGFSKLQTIEGLEYLDKSNVINMSYMFSNCTSLVNLNLEKFITKNVTEMQWMFENCNKLESLNLINFDTTGVTKMQGMFYGCRTIQTLDLSNFNTANVTDMNNMFSACSKLANLDISSFVTLKVTDMSNMFSMCYQLNNLDLSNFNTTSVTDMSWMFNTCSSLSNLNLSSFRTTKVIKMNGMFNDCQSLTYLDLNGFDFSTTTGIANLFTNCNNLTTTININSTTINNYTDIFNNVATSNGAQITVNYTNASSNLVDQMISSKTSTSNVVKGTLIT